MILQPSLVVVLGKQWEELPSRVRRWFEPQAQDAMQFLLVDPNGDFSAAIDAAVNRLRSGEMLAHLTASVTYQITGTSINSESLWSAARSRRRASAPSESVSTTHFANKHSAPSSPPVTGS